MLKRTVSHHLVLLVSTEKKPQLYDTDKRFKFSFDHIGKISKLGKVKRELLYRKVPQKVDAKRRQTRCDTGCQL